ncbi:MAG: MBOAT family O-acyltransferase, partial [bacterium]
IRLTRNFDRPYAAASLREFWRRWHISLTRWLRDYLYLPLGGRSRAVNTLLVFLASGLWHGADWTFVLWGLYHGALLLLERRLPEKKRPAATFAAVSFGWLLFRAERIGDVGLLLSRLFTGWSPAAAFRLMGLDSAALLALPLLLALLRVLDGEEPRPLTRLSAAKSALLLLAVAISWLMGLRAGAENAFLYFQF